MTKTFKIVHGAQNEYLSNNKDFVIIETTLTEQDAIYNSMVEFCHERIKDSSWSIALLPEYSTITVRMWDKKVVEQFKLAFTEYVK